MEDASLRPDKSQTDRYTNYCCDLLVTYTFESRKIFKFMIRKFKLIVNLRRRKNFKDDRERSWYDSITNCISSLSL